ncbi:hypothetical protein BDP27DRAFT_1370605 [Rhodocollybia butyracea]|uniref:Uncharacterized protein n=1 Tax=Rhodocollybia butyracea TaxID=206335 RepID=A0A9P5PE01_9AGAR|nr:hypothetical protein BDP27DRAFT_1370605 [Rhodocollybia butyracea]
MFSIEEPSPFLNPASLKRSRSDSTPTSPCRSFSLQDLRAPSNKQPFVQTITPFDSSLFKTPIIPVTNKHQQKALKKLQELRLDSDARKDLTTQKLEERKGVSQYKEDWERSTPYPFTSCLAHVEIIEHDGSSISWIVGILDHNAACQNAVLERRPPVPLHEHVYEVALEQLCNGASITAIQEKNQEMLNTKLYRDMKTYNPTTANAAKGLGVDTRELPQYNVDDWLNPHSPNFRSEISEAVFHYSQRAECGIWVFTCRLSICKGARAGCQRFPEGKLCNIGFLDQTLGQATILNSYHNLSGSSNFVKKSTKEPSLWSRIIPY